jgi:hypothetical protein
LLDGEPGSEWRPPRIVLTTTSGGQAPGHRRSYRRRRAFVLARASCCRRRDSRFARNVGLRRWIGRHSCPNSAVAAGAVATRARSSLVRMPIHNRALSASIDPVQRQQRARLNTQGSADTRRDRRSAKDSAGSTRSRPRPLRIIAKPAQGPSRRRSEIRRDPTGAAVIARAMTGTHQGAPKEKIAANATSTLMIGTSAPAAPGQGDRHAGRRCAEKRSAPPFRATRSARSRGNRRPQRGRTAGG